ncbi:MAG: hypothetical protein ABSH48_10295 [Verrucomicrobiota bacterium]|jgi:hypothetical protein
MNRTARRHVFLTLGLAGCLAGGLALLNFIIDPYNRYGLNRLGVYISAERECKSTYVTRYPHDALLLGNSRENRTQPDQLKGFRFFNAAISGATSEEIYYFLQHFARHERLVVLPVDLGEHDAAECHGDLFAPRGLTSAFDNLLNLETTGYSLRTITESFSKHPQRIGPDGTVPESNWVRIANRDDPQAAAFAIQVLRGVWDGYHCPSLAQMSYYVKISEYLRERAIPCVVVIPPMHEAVAQSLQSSPAAAEVAAWERQLKTIFPHVIDLSFSSYGAATNFYRCDPLHFKTEVGVRLMNREVLPFATRVLRETAPSAAGL